MRFRSCPLTILQEISFEKEMDADEDRTQFEAARSASRWHFLYFFPLPHQHGSLRPGLFRGDFLMSPLLRELKAASIWRKISLSPTHPHLPQRDRACFARAALTIPLRLGNRGSFDLTEHPVYLNNSRLVISLPDQVFAEKIQRDEDRERHLQPQDDVGDRDIELTRCVVDKQADAHIYE